MTVPLYLHSGSINKGHAAALTSAPGSPFHATDFTEGDQGRGVVFCNPAETPEVSRELADSLLYTFWELDTLPPELAAHLRRFRGVAVPSTYVAEVFQRAGVQASVIPHGVNLDVWRPNPLGVRALNFIAVAYDHPRKNLDGLVSAFHAAFPEAGDDSVPVRRRPTMTMKVHGDAARARRLEGPGITVVTDTFAPDKLAEMVRWHDWFVLPSRAEGFCVAALEAMAAGVPVIMTNATGHLDFVQHLHNGLLIPAERCPATPWGNWFEPDREELVRTLRYAMRGVETYAEMSTRARLTAEKYPWSRTVRLLAEAL